MTHRMTGYDENGCEVEGQDLDALADKVWRDALVPQNHDRHQAQAAIWRALDDSDGEELTPAERGYVTTKLMARLGYGS